MPKFLYLCYTREKWARPHHVFDDAPNIRVWMSDIVYESSVMWVDMARSRRSLCTKFREKKSKDEIVRTPGSCGDHLSEGASVW
jgi:hypothetical protein